MTYKRDNINLKLSLGLIIMCDISNYESDSIVE